VLRFGEYDLLHVSDGDHVDYFLGHFDADAPAFEVVDRGRLDHGDFYAPQSTDAPDGRTLTWGWLPEERDVPDQWDAGWSGAMSVPREVRVDDEGRLHQSPATELTALRREGESRELTVGESRTRLELSGRALELRLSVRLDDADGVELGVLESESGEERTAVRWEDRRLGVERLASNEGPVSSVESQWLTLPDRRELSLTVLVDGSVVEVFADEGRCLTSRVYPNEHSGRVSLRALGGEATVDVEGWRLGSMWTE
jgi:beta-fructofuranosidase